MTIMLPSALAIVIVGAIFLRQGAERRTGRGWQVAALIPLGLQVAVLLLFGIGEMASGDISGAGHLLPAAAAVLLGVLSWQRPLEGGIALILVGVFAVPEFRNAAVALLIMAAPQFASGVLFLTGALTARKEKDV